MVQNPRRFYHKVVPVINYATYKYHEEVWGVEIQFHAFLTSALDRDEWSNSRSGRPTHGKRASATHWVVYAGWAPESDFTPLRKNIWPRRESIPDSPVFIPIIVTILTDLSRLAR
jgi:hypothetical protein